MTDGNAAWPGIGGAPPTSSATHSELGSLARQPSARGVADRIGGPEESSLRREEGGPEVRNLARSGIFTAESRRRDEPPGIVVASAEDLIRVAESMSDPRYRGESPYYLQSRILRNPPPSLPSEEDLPTTENGRRAARPTVRTLVAPDPRPSSVPYGPLSPALVEFDAILDEIEPGKKRTRGKQP
jgi:hypothetical protein